MITGELKNKIKRNKQQLALPVYSVTNDANFIIKFYYFVKRG